ncbi:MAG: NUDIX domain-containing protein [Eubacteriales bacterium]|nr:NUDIX domain-containing protein [Eubacteriales bacterium]
MEIWDGYSKDGSLMGIDLIRGETIPQGLYHLVCEILVRHTDGDYLLMQRDLGKPKYGGLFEATAGGSALKGEESLLCAKRELLEETGIRADSLAEIGRSISHDTIYFSYLCVTNCDKSAVTLQEGETIAFKWVSEEDFIAFVNSGEMIPSQKLHLSDYFIKMGYMK